jgi:hypothetical protein
VAGRGSRLKGANGEREFFALSNKAAEELSWPYRNKEGDIFFRHPAPRHCEGQADNSDPHNVLPVAIEVKRQETLQLPNWIRQAKSQASEHQVPVLAYRRNREDWTILSIMDKSEWKRYLRWKLQKAT